MDIVHAFLGFLHDMPSYLTAWSAQLGPWSYVALFAVIFCETGLVVTPILPGDSLLFALGALCAAQSAYLNPILLGFVLWTAALCGDMVNYSIGRAFGKRLCRPRAGGKASLVNPEYLAKTQVYFEKHGGKTVVLARFAPILRTYSPFVAGMGQMRFQSFIAYCASGGAAWIGLFLAAGFFFGDVPAIKQNFHYALLGIAIVSFLPALWQFVQSRSGSSSNVQPGPHSDAQPAKESLSHEVY